MEDLQHKGAGIHERRDKSREKTENEGLVAPMSWKSREGRIRM